METVDFILGHARFSSLSRREKQVLALYDLTAKEQALRLGLSIHTVQTHRKNILKKLNCRSFADAGYQVKSMQRERETEAGQASVFVVCPGCGKFIPFGAGGKNEKQHCYVE